MIFWFEFYIKSVPFDLAGPQPRRSSKVGFAIFNFSEQKKVETDLLCSNFTTQFYLKWRLDQRQIRLLIERHIKHCDSDKNCSPVVFCLKISKYFPKNPILSIRYFNAAVAR